jgi:hypothetical protein
VLSSPTLRALPSSTKKAPLAYARLLHGRETARPYCLCKRPERLGDGRGSPDAAEVPEDPALEQNARKTGEIRPIRGSFLCLPSLSIAAQGISVVTAGAARAVQGLDTKSVF